MRLLLLFSLLSLASAIRRVQPTPKELPVCIIGAGIAGLSAAGELEKAKVPYVLIEGAGRVGGRVYPVRYEEGYLQLGATYINGKKNPIYEIAEANNLIDMNATNAAQEHVPLYTEKEVIQGEDMREFAEFTESLTPKYKDLERHGKGRETFLANFKKDFQSFLKRKNQAARRAHFDLLARMYVTDEETEWAALMEKYALSNYVHYAYGRTEFTLNRDGFHTILDVIRKRLGDNKVRYLREVTNIDYSNDNNVTVSVGREKFECSSAIVTVSLGYLKKHAGSLFTPKLPTVKENVIRALGFGNMQKLYLIYEKPWLDKSAYHTIGPANSTLFGRGLTFDVTPWNRKVVQFWISGPAVDAFAELSEEKVIDKITTHLRKTLKNVTVHRPKRLLRYMWHKDSLVLGSYTYLTPEAVAMKDPIGKLAEPILSSEGRPLVQFAGEATHSTIYQTTIGAFLSGQREARRLIEND